MNQDCTNNDKKENDECVESDEIAIAVEAGSPEDKVLQVLKHKGFDAELTNLTVVAGQPGRHQLLRGEGVICGKGVATAFTIWATLLPSGMLYLLSVTGPVDKMIPVLPRVYELLIRAGEAADDAGGTVNNSDGEGDE